jgi:hypothetical protein
METCRLQWIEATFNIVEWRSGMGKAAQGFASVRMCDRLILLLRFAFVACIVEAVAFDATPAVDHS